MLCEFYRERKRERESHASHKNLFCKMKILVQAAVGRYLLSPMVLCNNEKNMSANFH